MPRQLPGRHVESDCEGRVAVSQGQGKVAIKKVAGCLHEPNHGKTQCDRSTVTMYGRQEVSSKGETYPDIRAKVAQMQFLG